MLTLTDLHFAIEGKPLIEGAALSIPQGHKVGLVGRNGTGKTTLFRLLNGELEPDQGTIHMPQGLNIGGMAQETPATDVSLLDTVLAADTELQALQNEAQTASDPDRIAEIQLRLADIEAHSAEARASSILTGLGFDHAAQQRPTKDFSGGWRMRVALAAILFAQPDLLLLDEPTNYLDLEGTIWLENYLSRYPYTVIIISHDRGLLNRAVGHILHLSQRKLTMYTGNYDRFEATRRAKLELLAAAAKKQEAERAHLQSFVDRFRYKASKARQAQSRVKRLEKMQPIANLIEGNVAGFTFPDAEEMSPPILRLDDVDVGYGETTILHGLDLRIDNDDRIALLGANGQGKSTLSKLIAERLEAQKGSISKSSKLRVGYFAQHQVEELTEGWTPLEHMRALRPDHKPGHLRSILAQGGVGVDIADNPVERLSGGQKARLAMLIAMLDAPHLIILDEPTNHLDIESREALVHALTAYQGAIILVSHDPYLVDCVADRLWLVESGAVAPFDGDMEDYRRFLLNRRGVAMKQKEPKAAKPKPKAKKQTLTPLREELRKCEARLGKLNEMQIKIDTLLADPKTYEDKSKATALQIKRSEIVAATQKAEALWISAQDALDQAS
jgi:ATP-binding cassette subfamily F protein 3